MGTDKLGEEIDRLPKKGTAGTDHLDSEIAGMQINKVSLDTNRIGVPGLNTAVAAPQPILVPNVQFKFIKPGNGKKY